jgi:hypothetical protein
VGNSKGKNMRAIWKNKKYPGTYTGHYVRDTDGERNFLLKKEGGVRRITFESHQAAKKLGWVKK